MAHAVAVVLVPEVVVAFVAAAAEDDVAEVPAVAAYCDDVVVVVAVAVVAVAAECPAFVAAWAGRRAAVVVDCRQRTWRRSGAFIDRLLRRLRNCLAKCLWRICRRNT